ncbi:MAG TPA: thioredoxin family protein [Fimbriimonadaceae bacterium]|nr:thioredoxin family protein [Fimbriimonadaceae bacterium]
MLDAQTYPDKGVIKFAGQVVPLKIDCDAQGAVAEKYGIQGTPTIMFLDANGKVIGSFLGFRPPKDFIDESKKVLKNYKSK